MRLTKTVVDAARYQGDGVSQDIRWDDTQRGFGLRVYPSGVRSFVVAYRVSGRKRIVSLGQYGEKTSEGPLTVQRARKKAEKVWVAAREGKDLLEKEATGKTVAELADRYLEVHAKPKKARRSVKEDKALLKQIIQPKLGKRSIESISRADVRRLHHSLRATPFRANRALALLSKMLNLAESWGMRPDNSNPCRHVERYPEPRRGRFLSTEEVETLGKVLSKAEKDGKEPPSAIAAIRLLILTGCRREEILSLRWDQVDFERSLLNFEESKTGRKTVPLGAAALELLSKLPRVEGNRYALPGKKEGAHFVGLPKVWQRLRETASLEDVRLHDLRHTFGGVGAGGGLSLPIIGKILGHTQAATTQRYAHLAADPLRQAADRISGEIAAALNGKAEGEVVRLDH